MTIFVSSRAGCGKAHSSTPRSCACVALVNDEVSHYRLPLAPSAACVAFHFLFPVSRHTEFFINVHLPFSEIGCRRCCRVVLSSTKLPWLTAMFLFVRPSPCFNDGIIFGNCFFLRKTMRTAPWHDCLQHHALMSEQARVVSALLARKYARSIPALPVKERKLQQPRESRLEKTTFIYQPQSL